MTLRIRIVFEVAYRTGGETKTCQDGANQTFRNRRQRSPARTCESLKRKSDQLWVDSRDGTGPKQRCLVGQTLVFLGAGYERFRYGRNRGMLKRHRGPLQRNLQHFIHGLDKMQRETGEDLLRYFR